MIGVELLLLAWQILWEGIGMGTELRVMLPGPEGSADARRAVRILDKVLELLNEIDQAAVRRTANAGTTTWGFTHLALGSVDTTIAPTRPARGRELAEAERALYRVVHGFRDAQEAEGIPAGWTPKAARLGAEIGRMIGGTVSTGLLLGVHRDGKPVSEITVTRAAGDHLIAALRTKRRSIGALVGTLESVSVHERNQAYLYLPPARRQSVPVVFRRDQFEQIRAALGKRVMISGILERGAQDIPTKLDMRQIEILPDVGGVPALGDLAGHDPDFTGGLDPADYLRELRGTA